MTAVLVATPVPRAGTVVRRLGRGPAQPQLPWTGIPPLTVPYGRAGPAGTEGVTVTVAGSARGVPRTGRPAVVVAGAVRAG